MDGRRRLAVCTLVILILALVGFGFQGTRHASAGVGHGLYEFGSYPGSAGLTSPHSAGTNPLFYWSELEPGEGAYNWGPLDQALAAAAAKGKTVIPRVYTNVAGWGQATPTWVFDAGAAWYYNSDFSRDNGMRQPAPTDPVFTAKFASFLTRLGARYDGDARIEFFQTNAGMGEYGEMVWGWPDQYKPPGWTAGQNLATVKQWIDRWAAAFPTTKLAIMLNCIGWNIAEDAADYAISRGFYIQQNDLDLGDSCRRALFIDRQARTRIIVEAENNGGQASTGRAFDGLIDGIFSHGFPVDYLVLHRNSFTDPQTASRLSAVDARLRADGGRPPPAPSAPPAPPPAPAPPPSPASAPSPQSTTTPVPNPTATPPPSRIPPSSSVTPLASPSSQSSSRGSPSPDLLRPAAPPIVSLYSPTFPYGPAAGPAPTGDVGPVSGRPDDWWLFALMGGLASTPRLLNAGRRWLRLHKT